MVNVRSFLYTDDDEKVKMGSMAWVLIDGVKSAGLGPVQNQTDLGLLGWVSTYQKDKHVYILQMVYDWMQVGKLGSSISLT